MNCPICDGVSLVMSERNDIEIDYCPKCRGVWLDRGELDKIIERSASLAAPQAVNSPAPASAARTHTQPPHYAQGHSPSHHDGGYYKKKKRESFLGELFDF
jgi:Zn-finger nucleic acid-binding protein